MNRIEFSKSRHSVEELKGMRILLKNIGYNIDKLSRVFCDLKVVVSSANINRNLLKKHSIVLLYHRTQELIVVGVIEI